MTKTLLTAAAVVAALIASTPARADLLQRLQERTAAAQARSAGTSNTPSVCAKSGPGYDPNSQWNDCTRLEQDINIRITNAFQEAARGHAGMGYGTIADAVKKAESCRAERATCGRNSAWSDALEQLARQAEERFFAEYAEGLIAADRGKTMPVENYSGAAAQQYRAGISAEWKNTYPSDDIVKVILGSNDWTKTRTRRWNSTMNQWQYNDVDALKCYVVVRKSATLSIVYPAFVNKDQLNGEIRYGVETKSTYSPLFISSATR